MKIHHVVFYRFRPGCDRIEEHLAAIQKFRDRTQGLLDLKCGKNLHPSSTRKYTHGFLMIFASPADLEMYHRSKGHQELVDAFKSDIEDKAIFDLEAP